MYGVSGYDLDSSNLEYQTNMGMSCVSLHTSSIKAIQICVTRRLSQIANASYYIGDTRWRLKRLILPTIWGLLQRFNRTT